MHRNTLEQLDAVRVGVRQCVTNALIPNLRTLFEIRLGISYVLEKEAEDRAAAYKVMHYVNKRSVYEMYDNKRVLTFRNWMNNYFPVGELPSTDTQSEPITANRVRKNLSDLAPQEREYLTKAFKGILSELEKGPLKVELIKAEDRSVIDMADVGAPTLNVRMLLE